jgi:hypothetical protein
MSMAQTSRRFGVRCTALLVAAAGMVAGILPLTPAAAQSGHAVRHQVRCELLDGRLYLGDPGAGGPAKFPTCSIHFDQLRPRSDGVIVILRSGKHSSRYSIRKLPASLQGADRDLIPWRHHPGAAKLGCALAAGRLYLGSAGPSHPRRKASCTVRIYQLSPDADGVVVVLTSGKHITQDQVVLRRLPHHPTAYLPIHWTS